MHILELQGIDVVSVIKSVFSHKTSKSTPSILFSTSTVPVCTKGVCEEIVFFDTKKNCLKYYASMYDIMNKGPLPHVTSIPCWNCTRTFASRPLGIPIRYVKFNHSSHGRRLWEAYLQKNNYISSSSPPEEIKDINGYFETEGVVCSWSCMKNFIQTHQHSSRYKDSTELMYFLHTQLVGKPLECPCAPSWRTLKKWGGHISDEDFENDVATSTFIDTVNVYRPNMFSLSNLYEQQ